jgi:hypothetical protein
VTEPRPPLRPVPSFFDQGDQDYRDFVESHRPAEQAVNAAIEQGWAEEVEPGVYRLTATGKARARWLLGLPDDVELI